MILNALIFGKLWQMHAEQRDHDTDAIITSLVWEWLLVVAAWPFLLLIPADMLRIPRWISMPLVLGTLLVLLLAAWPIYLLIGFAVSILWIGLVAASMQEQS